MRTSNNLVLSLVLAASCASSCRADGPPFAGVTLAGSEKSQVHLTADLDGDGRKDDVYLVQFDGRPLPGNIQYVWQFHRLASQPAAKGELAVAVVLNRKGKSVPFLIRMERRFFDNETWKSGNYQELMQVGHGLEPPKDVKGDSFWLATDTGANLYFHWDGEWFVASNQGDNI